MRGRRKTKGRAVGASFIFSLHFHHPPHRLFSSNPFLPSLFSRFFFSPILPGSPLLSCAFLLSSLSLLLFLFGIVSSSHHFSIHSLCIQFFPSLFLLASLPISVLSPFIRILSFSLLQLLFHSHFSSLPSSTLRPYPFSLSTSLPFLPLILSPPISPHCPPSSHAFLCCSSFHSLY